MSLSTKTIATVIAAIDAGHRAYAAWGEAVAAARVECKGMTPTEVRNAFLPHIASAYGMPDYNLPSGKGKHGESCTFTDPEHAGYESARKALYRVVSAITAPDANRTAPAPVAARIGRAQRAAGVAFLAEFDGDVKAAIAALRAIAAK